MQAVRDQSANETPAHAKPQDVQFLTPQEFLAGSLLTYDVEVPSAILRLGNLSAASTEGGRVRLGPLKMATLALTDPAASDEFFAATLTVKEACGEDKRSAGA